MRRAWQPSGPPPVAERCTCAKLGFARSGGAEAELRAVRVAIGSSISKRQSSRLRTAADSPGRSVLYSRISRSFSPLPVRSGGLALRLSACPGAALPAGCPRAAAPGAGFAVIPARHGAAPRQPPPSRARQGALRRGGCELCASQSRSENSGFRALFSFPFVLRLQIGVLLHLARGSGKRSGARP